MTYQMFITIVHVLGVVIGMGAALISDFLFSFYAHNKKLSHFETRTLRVLSNTVIFGLCIIIVSGVGIFLLDIDKYMNSTKFLAKMTILLVLIINGFILHSYISKSMIKKGFLSLHKYTNIRKLAFACGATSIVSWCSLMSLGVIDSITFSYTTLITIYISILVFSILISLIVESITFEK